MAKNFSKFKDKDILREIEKVDNMSNDTGKRIVELDINLIDDDPKNSQIYDMDDIDGLAVSIKDRGIINPVNVYKKSDGRYQLSAGHRRKKAAQKAGLTKIPAIISDWNDNETERNLTLLYDNISNRKEKPMERARALNLFITETQKLHEDWDIVELKNYACERFGINRGTADKLLALLRFIPELQEKAKNPDVYPYSALAYARSLTPEQQKQFSDELDKFVEKHGENQLTREDFIQIAKAIKNADYLSKQETEIKRKESARTMEQPDSVITDVEKNVSVITEHPTDSNSDFQESIKQERVQHNSTDNISFAPVEPTTKNTPFPSDQIVFDEEPSEEARRKEYIRNLENSSRDFIATLSMVLDAKSSDWISNQELSSTIQQLTEIENTLSNILGLLNAR